MSGHHVLTDHKGHTATIRSESEIRCESCQHTLVLPKPADPSKQPTPTPPKFHLAGTGVPPTSIPEWQELRAKRWPKRKPFSAHGEDQS